MMDDDARRLAERICDAQADAYDALGICSLPGDVGRLDVEIKRLLGDDDLFSRAGVAEVRAAVEIAEDDCNAHEAAAVARRMVGLVDD